MDPIAIVGIGCRFPGANGPAEFWRLLCDGVDAIGEVPAERWDLEALYAPDPAAPGKMSTRWGGFLAGIDQFDAPFFKISPREAARLDPQQRLLLEVAWEALEDAGQAAERLAGSPTGVFVGISAFDYGVLQFGDVRYGDAHGGPGGALSIAANRLSYVFDFRGPSLAVDTACSSSLVAVHLACESLARGECDLALAGGVNAILLPGLTVHFSKAGFMAPDGRCKAFDAAANGYVRGEGAGVVILKPLARALSDRDAIYAVIRGSAINQDGRSNGLTAPNGLAQEAVLRVAYSRAGVDPARVAYVEAHGTGTALGDPIEAQALGTALGEGRPGGRPCRIGSVKTNFGHLEAAAGIAGLIKTALALRHGEIPPSLHYHAPNPHIDFEELKLQVQDRLGPWPDGPGPHLAGVSAFGFGGSNAHVVLAAAPGATSDGGTSSHADLARDGRGAAPRAGEDEAERPPGPARLVPLSARSPGALQDLAGAYRDRLRAEPAAGERPGRLEDVAYTAALRRSHHDYRLAVVARSRVELADRLDGFLRGEAPTGLASGRRPAGRRPKVVFVFPGQGSQWPGMGRELARQEPIFRDALERCEQAMRPHVDWSLLEVLTGEDGTPPEQERIDVIQPSLFAIQVALAALWRAWGVEPDAVIGHSMGEAAAAYVAGALSLEDAARIICRRSRLLRRVSGQGRMAAVELSLDQSLEAIADCADRVAVAASNGPRSTVLSGDPEALEAVLSALERRDVFCRRVKVDVASHSPQMDPLRAGLLRELEGLSPRDATLRFYSTVTGVVETGVGLGAEYWAQNLRAPVLFAPTVRRVLEDGLGVFVELSPHPLLTGALQETAQYFGRPGTALPSLNRHGDERAALLASLGGLYALGYPIDWGPVAPPGGRLMPLPRYAWQHERYWLEPLASQPAGRDDGVARHPLLGQHTEVSLHPGTHLWEVETQAAAYLADHRVEGLAVLPAAAYLEAALAAGRELLGDGALVVEDARFEQPFAVESNDRRLQLAVSSEGPDAADFRFSSAPVGRIGETGWARHTEGQVRREVAGGPGGPALPLSTPGKLARSRGGPSTSSGRTVDSTVRPELVEGLTPECFDALEQDRGPAMPAADYYRELAERGLDYRPAFRGLERVWRGQGEALGRLRLPKPGVTELGVYELHPALLDACFQVLGAALPSEPGLDDKRELYLPIGLRRLRALRRPRPEAEHWCRATLRQVDGAGASVLEGDLVLLDQDGQLVLEALGLRLERVRRQRRFAASGWLYQVRWQPAERGEAAPKHSGVSPSTSSGRTDFSTVRPELVEGPPRLRATYPGVLSGPPGRWLLFRDATGVADELATLLEARGEQCVMVAPGAAYAARGAREYRIDPASSDDYRRLLAEAVPAGAVWRGVLHLWSLDLGRLDAPGEPSRVAQEIGVESVLPLVQALAGASWRDPPRLWLVTARAQPVGLEIGWSAVAQAPIWGLGRVVAHEHPELRCTLVDLDGSGGAPALFDELWSDDREDQVALSDGRRLVPRLIPYDAAEPASGEAPGIALRADRTYLITGGLGALGLTLARWMVEQGARHLALVGRRPPSPTAERELRELEQAGARVRVLRADVADEAALCRALAELGDAPPLGGVAHAAGILEDCLVRNLEVAGLRRVMAPKVDGAWNLHRATLGQPLDFFVLFSSAAGLFGSPGQANYAAASAGLDVLAHYRRARGLPALSIDWGPWSEIGLAARPDRAGRLALQGFSSLEPARGLDLLGQVLGPDAAQVGVFHFSPRQWQQSYPKAAGWPFLSRLVEADEGETASARPAEARSEVLTQPAGPVRLNAMRAHVRDQIARVLRVPPGRFDLQVPLQDLGFDSLMGLELRNRLEASLGLVLSGTLVWAYPTADALARGLLERLEQEVEPVAGPAPGGMSSQPLARQSQDWADGGAARPVISEGADGPSEDELATMLAETLRTLEEG